MSTFEIIFTIIALGIAGLLFIIWQKVSNKDTASAAVALEKELAILQKELENIKNLQQDQRRELQGGQAEARKEISFGLAESRKTMQEQFAQTLKTIEDVTKNLAEVKNTNKQVLDISSQLQNLQNILKNPKQRGVLGEYWLETLLQNILTSPNYAMQYHLGKSDDGAELIADAVVFVNKMIVPIDAKFTLENYNRMCEEQDATKRAAFESEFKKDVKIRIEETSKYIRPDLGTTEFAFMFVPAEGVYHHLINAEVGSGLSSQNLIEFAFKKHVLIVAPTSFYAYLQTVLLGLRQLKVEEQTHTILKHVGEFRRHFLAYSELFDKVGKNLSITVNQYDLSLKEIRKLSRDMNKITSEDLEEIDLDVVEPPLLEK